MTTIEPATQRTSALPVSLALAVRNLTRVYRFPKTTLVLVFFPVFFVVVSSGQFGGITSLPGFPTRTLLDWMLPMGMVWGAATAGMIPGFGVAVDIENGYLDRLLIAPVTPTAIVAGSLLAAMGRALVPFVLLLAIGLGIGIEMPGGPGTVLLALVAAEGAALCAAGWSVGLALRGGSVRRTRTLMQLGVTYPFLLSTAQVPMALLTGWLHEVAEVNPVTPVLTMARQGFIGALTWDQTWPGLVVLTAAGLLLTRFAARGLLKLRP